MERAAGATGIGGGICAARPGVPSNAIVPPGRDQTVAAAHRLVGVQPRNSIDAACVPAVCRVSVARPNFRWSGLPDVHVLEPRQRQELDAMKPHAA